ncbi:N-acetylmuramic acid 6-phosphate etherase [Pseudidiomarina piscicola]|uniref:N-acetylmuramic acid 6-phosphate etherase n=1 Tax=Pseudidiomarina piscicola TaxID=2614830 RepID=A0A6S6WRD7_9GAMM|nr:N-acetylmuramic acid 6-phosphate etherase [Pseudidiomarina piscicola]CAB0150728.1 N-acetylmuramic acid 6-phosphate etherase [Pseudidiomarina piscicola]VZT40234.1 N-acetylmuramic acid 6-phosphate etherase [Pseudomonas aeruginosa]
MEDTKRTADLLAQLNKIVSEGRNPETMEIDTLSSEGILRKLNHEDAQVAPAVATQIPSIALAVDAIVERLQRGGRLFYIGAGTSGRLGILDAVECRPTFSVPDDLVQGIIAGGEHAIQYAVEGAEDDRAAGVADVKALELSEQDVLVGLSASGRTPYVVAALEYANTINCVSVSVTCNPDSPLMTTAKIGICPVVGAEALTGSTRMKSGTAQKLVLNMLSTASMIRLGKTYENLMVDVNASNEKLRARAIRIVMQATDCERATAEQALKEAKNRAKLAILMILTGTKRGEAEALLDQENGFLRRAVEQKS